MRPPAWWGRGRARSRGPESLGSLAGMVLGGGGALAGARADQRAAGWGAVSDVAVAGTWPRPWAASISSLAAQLF